MGSKVTHLWTRIGARCGADAHSRGPALPSTPDPDKATCRRCITIHKMDEARALTRGEAS